MEVEFTVRPTYTRNAFTNKITAALKRRETRVICEKPTTTTNREKINSVSGIKRKSEVALECQSAKRLKMDQCQGILAKLMEHKWGYHFLRPHASANAIYYRVIKHPMDFGTIKQKLKLNRYIEIGEFEADVRLVLANAKLYYLSNSQEHVFATKLDRLFDVLWMTVKEKEMSLKGKVIREPIVTYNANDKCPEVLSHSSPSKALRVAKLKARFVETILKAQTMINLQRCNKTDVIPSQMDKERFSRTLDKEKARADSEAKAAELRFQIEAEYKLQQQRHEREAARAAIEKMERSVDVTDNLGAMRELESLMGRRGCWNRSEYGKTKSPLEHLGLFLKPEYRLGYDDDELFLRAVNLEDGEIVD